MRQTVFTRFRHLLPGALFLYIPLSISAAELSGNIALEGRCFPEEPAYASQEQHNASVAIEPEFYHRFSSGSQLVLKPFARLDSSTDQRSHSDIREANFLYAGDNLDVQIGLSKVFWGAAEFVHLVDIINQTDGVEGFDGEEKLGQPMLRFSLFMDRGTVDAFVLPWFRERTFGGEKDRLRTPVVVDTEQAIYESAAEQHHVDFALRYSTTFGDADVGLYHFVGTSREPDLLPGGTSDTPDYPVLLPFYPQISQTGLDLQMAVGRWLLKGEALYRSGQGRPFAAAVCGVEYTFFGINDSAMDLGLIGEYIFDDRADNILSPFNNDMMGGLRLALNDTAGTEILTGIMKDVELSTYIFSVEGKRRIGEQMLLHIEAMSVLDADGTDPASAFADDPHLIFELQYFF
ncbi:MAG: hypothetical protein ACL93V_01520 [Candidatus Electrothrix sp. YB6]